MYGVSPSHPNECSVNSLKKYQPEDWYLDYWWAQEDLNDYIAQIIKPLDRIASRHYQMTSFPY
jgi:hypothetical protein